MYAGDLRDKLQWDTLYHEHLTFYSLGTLERLLSRHGFHIFDAVRIPMHGGSLRIAARKRISGLNADYESVKACESKTSLNAPETWMSFGRHIGRKIQIVGRTLEQIGRAHV